MQVLELYAHSRSGKRRSGRSTDMVRELPESGDCYIVIPDDNSRHYFYELVRKHRDDHLAWSLKNRNCFILGTDSYKLRGATDPVFVDHYVWEFLLDNGYMSHAEELVLILGRQSDEKTAREAHREQSSAARKEDKVEEPQDERNGST